MHTYNPSSEEAEAGKLMVLDRSGQHSKNLSEKKKERMGERQTERKRKEKSKLETKLKMR